VRAATGARALLLAAALGCAAPVQRVAASARLEEPLAEGCAARALAEIPGLGEADGRLVSDRIDPTVAQAHALELRLAEGERAGGGPYLFVQASYRGSLDEAGRRAVESEVERVHREVTRRCAASVRVRVPARHCAAVGEPPLECREASP
jgi:hypothetical protein